MMRSELLLIKNELKCAEHNIYANVGPSPVLVPLREAMKIVDRCLGVER